MAEENQNALVSQEWTDETANFRPAGVAPAAQEITVPPTPKDEPKVEEPPKDDENKGDGQAADDADKTKAEVTDEEAQAAVEKGKLPKWMQDRIARSNRKAEEATGENARLKAEMAELRARLDAVESPKPAPTEAPNPDDFDTVAEYEAAKADWTKAQKKPKTEPAKTDAAAPALPPHIDKSEFEAATELFLGLGDDITKGLTSTELPLSADIIMAMSDVAEGDAKVAKKVAEFVIAAPHIIKAISAMGVRQQAGAFERAFMEYTGPKPKPEVEDRKTSKAPPPPPRERPRAAPAKVANDFKDFEAQRNAEEIENGRRPW